MSQEFELFKGTTFSDLMRDVYHNSKKKSRQIDTLIKKQSIAQLMLNFHVQQKNNQNIILLDGH